MRSFPAIEKGGPTMRSMQRSWLMLVPLVAMLGAVPLGCSSDDEGSLSGNPDDAADSGAPVDPDQQGPFTCDGRGAADLAAPTFARRLTRRQVQRTLTDVFGRFLDPAAASTMVSTALATASVPFETERYKRWDNDFSSVYAQSFFGLADSLAKSIASDANYATFVKAAIDVDKGACGTVDVAGPSVDCQKQLIRNVGLRLLRHRLADAEVDTYLQEYAAGDARTAFGNLVFRMLLAPNALFQLELNEQPYPGRTDVLKLSSASIANRLSYTFWNAPPDERLLTLAQTTDLSVDADFSAALDYVLAKASFEDSTQEFFGDWLRLDKVPKFESNNPTTFAVYAGDVTYDASLRDEMLREIPELGTYLSNSGGTFKDLFTTDVSFARGPELMKLYGVKAPAPASVNAGNAFPIPANTHPGVLTRAAMLATSSGAKNPVIRGVRIRRDVLCLPTPPPVNVSADQFAAPPYDVNMTARQRYAQKTSAGSCAGCHTSINPPGFALSNYNGLGRYETTEPAFNEDGSYANKQLNVDATADLSSVLGAGAQATNPAQFMGLLAERAEAKKCFSSAYAEYFLSRATSEGDGCRLNRMYNQLQKGKSLKEFMRSMAMDPEFRMRKL
jgi:hypothetical protein